RGRRSEASRGRSGLVLAALARLTRIRSAERTADFLSMDHARSALQPAEPAPASAARAPARSVAVGGKRDLRLDLFRGLALWLIFLDHIPSNAVSWLTIRNYGFSDATEIFVFISGYTAAFVYGRTMRDRGVIVSGARMLKRAWQVYVAHIF